MTSSNILPRQLATPCETSTAATSCIGGNCPSRKSSYYQLDINYNPGKESVQLHFLPKNENAHKGDNEQTVADNDARKTHNLRAHSRNAEDMFKPVCELNKNAENLVVENYSQTIPSSLLKTSRKGRKRHSKNKSLNSTSRQHSDDTNANKSGEKDSPTNQKNIIKEAVDKLLKKRDNPKEGCEETAPTNEKAPQGKSKHRTRSSKRKTQKDAEIQTGDKMLKGNYTKHKPKSKKEDGTAVIDYLYQPQTDEAPVPSSSQNQQIYFILSPSTPFKASSNLCVQGKEAPAEVSLKSSSGKNRSKRRKKRIAHPSLETKYKEVQNTSSTSCAKVTEKCEIGTGIALGEIKKEETVPVASKKKDKKMSNVEDVQTRNKNSAIVIGENKIECSTQVRKRSDSFKNLRDIENARKAKKHKTKKIPSSKHRTSIKTKKSDSRSVDGANKKQGDTESVDTIHAAGDAGIKLKRKSKKQRHLVLGEELTQTNGNDFKLSEAEHNKNQLENKIEVEKPKNKHTGLVVESKKSTTQDTTVNEQLKHSKKRSEDKQKHNQKSLKIGTTDVLLDQQVKNSKNPDKIIDATIGNKRHKLKHHIKNEQSNKSDKVDEKDRLTGFGEVKKREKSPKRRKKHKRSHDGIKMAKKTPSKHSNIIIAQDTSIVVATEKHHKKTNKSENTHDTTPAEVTEGSSTKNNKKTMEAHEARRKSKNRKTQINLTNPAVIPKDSVKSILKSPVISVSTVDTKQERSVYSATTLTSNLSAILASKDSNYSDISSALELIQILQQQTPNAGKLANEVLSTETVKCLEAIKQNKIITKRDGQKVIKITKNQLEAIINKINKTPSLKQLQISHNQPKEAKATVKPHIRKEVSFSELNLKPVASSYEDPPTPFHSFHKKLFDKLSFLNGPKLFASKEKKDAKSKKRNKANDHKSIVSEAITKREKFQYVNGKRYPLNRTIRNFAYSENIIEKSIKTLRENGSRTLGFTVEGIEPPKMLKSITNSNSFTKKGASKFSTNLHVTVMSLVEIQPNLQEFVKKLKPDNAVDDTIEERQPILVDEQKVSQEVDKPVIARKNGSHIPVIRNRSLSYDKSRRTSLPPTRRSKSSSSESSKPPTSFAKQSTTLIGQKLSKYQQCSPVDSQSFVTGRIMQEKSRSPRDYQRGRFTSQFSSKSLEVASNAKHSIAATKERSTSKENFVKNECASFGQLVMTKMNEYVEDYGSSSKDEDVDNEVIDVSRNSVCKGARNQTHSKVTKSTQSFSSNQKMYPRARSASNRTSMDKVIGISERRNVSANEAKSKTFNKHVRCSSISPTRCRLLDHPPVPSRENTFKLIKDTNNQNTQIRRGSSDSMTSEWSLKYGDRYPRLVVCKPIEDQQPKALDDSGKSNSLKENLTRKKKLKPRKMSLTSSLVNSFSTVSVDGNCSDTLERLSKVEAPVENTVSVIRQRSLGKTGNNPTITVCQTFENLNSTAFNIPDKEDHLNTRRKSALEKLSLTGALVSTFSIVSLVGNSTATSETKPKLSETEISDVEQKVFGVTHLVIASSEDEPLPEVSNDSANVLNSFVEDIHRKKKSSRTSNTLTTNLIDNSHTPETESAETANNVSEMGDISLSRITEEESSPNSSHTSQRNIKKDKPKQVSCESGKRLQLSEGQAITSSSILPILKQIDQHTHKTINPQQSKQIILYKQFRVQQEVNEQLKMLSRDMSKKIFEIVSMASNHILELQNFTLPKSLLEQKLLRKSFLNVKSYCVSEEVPTSELDSSDEEQIAVVNLTNENAQPPSHKIFKTLTKKSSANAKNETTKDKSKADQEENVPEIRCSSCTLNIDNKLKSCPNNCLPTHQTGDDNLNRKTGITKAPSKEINSVIDSTSDSGSKLTDASFNDTVNVNYTKTTVSTGIKTEAMQEIIPKTTQETNRPTTEKISTRSAKKESKLVTEKSSVVKSSNSHKLSKSKAKRSSTKSSKASSSSENQDEQPTNMVKNEPDKRNESDVLIYPSTSETSFVTTSNTSDYSAVARVIQLQRNPQDEMCCKIQDMGKTSARSISVNSISKQGRLTKATQYSLDDLLTYPTLEKRPSRSTKSSDYQLKKTEEKDNRRDRSSNSTIDKKSTLGKDSSLSQDAQPAKKIRDEDSFIKPTGVTFEKKSRSSSRSSRSSFNKATQYTTENDAIQEKVAKLERRSSRSSKVSQSPSKKIQETKTNIDRTFEKIPATLSKATQYARQSNHIQPTNKTQEEEESVARQFDSTLERKSSRLSKASSKKLQEEENQQSVLVYPTFELISKKMNKATQYIDPTNTNTIKEDHVTALEKRSTRLVKISSKITHEEESEENEQGSKIVPKFEKPTMEINKPATSTNYSHTKPTQEEDGFVKQTDPILEKRSSRLSRASQNLSKTIPEEEFTNDGLIDPSKTAQDILSELDTLTSSIYENKSVRGSQVSAYSSLSDESQLTKIVENENETIAEEVKQPGASMKPKLEKSPTRTSKASEGLSLGQVTKSAKSITKAEVKNRNERDILFDSTSERSSTKTSEASDNASELHEANSDVCVRKHFFIRRKRERRAKSEDGKSSDYVPQNVIHYRVIDVGVNTDARDVDSNEISRLANLVKLNVMKELRTANLIKQNRIIGKIVTHNEIEMKQIDEIIERNIAEALKQTVCYVMGSAEPNASRFEVANTPQDTLKDLTETKLASVSKIGTSVSSLRFAQRHRRTFKETSQTKASSISKIGAPSNSPKRTFKEAPDVQLPGSSKVGSSFLQMSDSSQRALKDKSGVKSTIISKIAVSSSKLQVPTKSSSKEASDVKLPGSSKTGSCLLETSDTPQSTAAEPSNARLSSNIAKFREWTNMRLQKNINLKDAQGATVSKPEINNQAKLESPAGKPKKLGELQAKSNSWPTSKNIPIFNNEVIYEVASRTSSQCQTTSAKYREQKKEAVMEKVIALISGEPDFQFLESRLDKLLGIQQEPKPQAQDVPSSTSQAKPPAKVVVDQPKIVSQVKPLEPPFSYQKTQVAYAVSTKTCNVFSPRNDSVNTKVLPQAKAEAKAETQNQNKESNFGANSTPNVVPKPSDFRGPFRKPEPIEPCALKPLLPLTPKGTENDLKVTYLQNISKIPKLVPKHCSIKVLSGNQLKPKETKSIFTDSRKNAPIQTSRPEELAKCLTNSCEGDLENADSIGSKQSSISRPKRSSCLYTKVFNKGRPLTTHEKRKQYGEHIRHKKNQKSEAPEATEKVVNNKCRYYCEEQVKSIVSELLEERSGKTVPPSGFVHKSSNPSTSNQSKAKGLKPPSNITEPQDVLDTNYYSKLGCYICDKVGYASTENDVVNTTTDEDDGRGPLSSFKTKKLYRYPTVPTMVKPARSNKCLNQNQQYKSAPLADKEDRVYQAFTVTADHPHVTDVFKNKFKSAESSISLFSRESLFSCENYLNYISPNKSSASFSSANVFGNKTVNNVKSSSLLNTNCSDEAHQMAEESKRFINYKKMVNGIGARLRKRNFGRRTSRSSNRNLSATSKDFFNTIEQNCNSMDGKKTTVSSPLTVTPSFEFCHSTPDYTHQDVESTDKFSELSHKNRPKRITRRNVSLLEACQRLKKRSLTNTESYGAANKNLKGAEAKPNSVVDSSQMHAKNDEYDPEEYFRDKYKNVNRKTFFKDTKSLIYQNLEKTSNKLKSVPERKSKSPSSQSSNDNRTTNPQSTTSDKAKSAGKKYKMTKVGRKLNQSISKHHNDSGAEYSAQSNPTRPINSQNKNADTAPNNSKPRRNPKFFPLKKDTLNTNKPNMEDQAKKTTNKQSKLMKPSTQVGFGDDLFRNGESKANNTHSDTQTEEDSDSVFSPDEDSEPNKQRARNSDTEDSGDCFNVFAYNNVIELDMDYQPLFATCTDFDKSSQAFGQNLPKSKLFRCSQFSQNDKRSLKDIFYGDDLSRIPVTPTSDITESGYESYISKNSSLRKFFTPEESVLDNFTAAFKCFDQEVCSNERAFNSLFIVNAFPVSANGKCSFSQACSDSYTTDTESLPCSSRQQKRPSPKTRSLHSEHFHLNLPDEPCTFTYDEPTSFNKSPLERPDTEPTYWYEVDKKRPRYSPNHNAGLGMKTGLYKDVTDNQIKKPALQTPADKIDRNKGNNCKQYSPTRSTSPTTKQGQKAPQVLKTHQREMSPIGSDESAKRPRSRIKGLIQSISKQFHTSRKFDEDPDDLEEVNKQNQTRQKLTVDAKERKLPQLKSDLNNQTNLPRSKKKDAGLGMSKTLGQGSSQRFDCLRKQVEQCHEYAEKVCKESKLREQGLHKQFLDFKEIPLRVLLGKKDPSPKEPSPPFDDHGNIFKRSKKLSKIRILDEDVQPIEKVSNLKIDKNSRSKRSLPRFMRSKKIISLDELDKGLSNPEVQVSEARSITTIQKLLKSKEKCCSLFMEVLRRLYEESDESAQSTNGSKATKTPYDITGVSESLKHLSKESEMPLKEALDMIYAKMLEGVSDKNSTSVKTNSQEHESVTSEQSVKNLPTNHITKEALISLKELLDMIFETIFQGICEEGSCDSSKEVLTKQPSSEITLEKQLIESKHETYKHQDNWTEESKELIKIESNRFKKLSKESLQQLKKVLDKAFEKILQGTAEKCVCDSSKELIIVERLSSQKLQEPPQETLSNLTKAEPSTILKKLSIESLNPLRELLDRVFEKILQGTSDDCRRDFSPSSSMELEQLSSERLLKNQLQELTCKNRISLDKQLDGFIRSEATSLKKLSKEALHSLRELLDLVFQKILQGTPDECASEPPTEAQGLPLKTSAKEHAQESFTKESGELSKQKSSISLKELLETVFEKLLTYTSEERVCEPLEELSTELEISKDESLTTLKTLLEMVCSKLKDSKERVQCANLANLKNASEQLLEVSSQQFSLYASELSQQESLVEDVRGSSEGSAPDRDGMKKPSEETPTKNLSESSIRNFTTTTSENLQKTPQLLEELENKPLDEFPQVRSDPIKGYWTKPKQQIQEALNKLLEVPSRKTSSRGNLKQIPELDKNTIKKCLKKLPKDQLIDSFKESSGVLSYRTGPYGNIKNNAMRGCLRKSPSDQLKYPCKELSEPSIYSCTTSSPNKFLGKLEIEGFSNLFHQTADKPLQGSIVEKCTNQGPTLIEPIDLSKKPRNLLEDSAGIQRATTKTGTTQAAELESPNVSKKTSENQEDSNKKLTKRQHKSLPKVSIKACGTTTCNALSNLCKESTISLKELLHTILENALLNAPKESIHSLLKEVLWESFEKASELPVKLSYNEPTKETSEAQLHKAPDHVKDTTKEKSFQEYALTTCKNLIKACKGSTVSLRQLLDVVFEMILSNAPKESVSKLTKEVLWDSIKELFELPLQSCTVESCRSCKSLSKSSQERLSQVSSINISDLSFEEDMSVSERSMKEPSKEDSTLSLGESPSSRCDNLKQLSKHSPIPLNELLDMVFEKLLLNISSESLAFLSKARPAQLMKTPLDKATKKQSCTKLKSKELLESTVKELSSRIHNMDNFDFLSTLLKGQQQFRNSSEQPNDELGEGTGATCKPLKCLAQQTTPNQLQAACTDCSTNTYEQGKMLSKQPERQGPPKPQLPGCTKSTCKKLQQPPQSEAPSRECTRATCKFLRSLPELPSQDESPFTGRTKPNKSFEPPSLDRPRTCKQSRSFSEERPQNVPSDFGITECTRDTCRGFANASTQPKQVLFESPLYLPKKSSSDKALRNLRRVISKESREQLERELDLIINESKRSLRNKSVCLEPVESFFDEQTSSNEISKQNPPIESKRVVPPVQEPINKPVEVCTTSTSMSSSFLELARVTPEEIKSSTTPPAQKQIKEPVEVCTRSTSFQEPSYVLPTPPKEQIQKPVEVCTKSTCMSSSFRAPPPIQKQIKEAFTQSSFEEPTPVVEKATQESVEVRTESTSIGSSFQEPTSVVEKATQESVDVIPESTSIGSSFQEPRSVAEKATQESVDVLPESTSIGSSFQEPTHVAEKQIQESVEVCTKSTSMASLSQKPKSVVPEEIKPPVQEPIKEVCTKSTSMQDVVTKQDIKLPTKAETKKQHKKSVTVSTRSTCTINFPKTKGVEAKLGTKYKTQKKEQTILVEVCRKNTCTKNQSMGTTPSEKQHISLCTSTKDLLSVPGTGKQMKKVVETCTDTSKTNSSKQTKGVGSKALISTIQKTRLTLQLCNASTQIKLPSKVPIDHNTTTNTSKETSTKKLKSIAPSEATAATTTYIMQLQSETPFKTPIKQLLQKQAFNTSPQEFFDIDCKDSSELSQEAPFKSMKLDQAKPAGKKSKISFRSFVDLCKKKSRSKKPNALTQPQLQVFNVSQKPGRAKIEQTPKEEEARDADEDACSCVSLEEKDSLHSDDVQIQQSKSFHLTPFNNKPEYSAVYYIDNPSQDKIEPPSPAENKENVQVQTKPLRVKTKEEVLNPPADIEYSFLLTQDKSEQSMSDMELFEKLAAHKTKAQFDVLHKHETAEAQKTAEKKNALKKLRDSLTDKELFEKLLDSYEKEEQIVDRLSNDVDFFQSQLELVKSKESIETLFKDYGQTSQEKVLPDSEEQFISSLSIDSSPDFSHAKSRNSRASSAKAVEVASISKKGSKSKLSGFKSKVTRLFKTNDAVKEIVAPRDEDPDKLSLDRSFLSSQSSELTTRMGDDVGVHHQIANVNSQTDQKVKFSSGSKNFQEEKKILDALEVTANTSVPEVVQQRASVDSADSNIVRPDDLGKCFLRGFRSDYVALNGSTCLNVNKEERKSQLESVIDFSERDTPLEYLLALGFSIDEASNAIKDEDVKNRLYAAITEARIWINQISTVQGTLLYLIAYKAKPKTMRYFLQLVEAIINRRINNAVKLNGFLRLLEKVEDGDLNMINILGSSKFNDEENEEKIVKKQLRQLFINVYKIADHDANLKGKPLSKNAIILLRILAAKYRAGLHPHLELIARYIGQGLLKTEVQLEAAMIYLSRLDTADVNLKEFEQYCAIKCKEDDKHVGQTKESLTDDEITKKYHTVA